MGQLLESSSEGKALCGQFTLTQSSDALSCAILTMPANDAMKTIHHRMPVMLTANAYDQGLTVSNTDMQPFVDRSAAIVLRLTPVNHLVNHPGVEHPNWMIPSTDR